jgi:hypothetical protein
MQELLISCYFVRKSTQEGSDFLAGVNEITLTYAREAPLWY